MAKATRGKRTPQIVALAQLACAILFGVLLLRAHGPAVAPTALAFLVTCAALAASVYGGYALNAARRNTRDLEMSISTERSLKTTLELRVAERTVELDDAQRVLQRMWWLGQQITLELDPRRVLDRFLEAAADVAKADGAALGLISNDTEIEIAAASGTLAHFTGQNIPVADSAMGRIIRSGGTWCVADVRDHRARVHVGLIDTAESAFRGVAVVPVHRRGERIGAVCIVSAAVRAFSQIELERVEAMADLLSVALANAELFQTMKQAEWRFRTLFRAAPDAVLTILNATGRIREANDAVRDVFDIAPHQLIGRTLHELIPASDLPAFESALASAFGGAPARVELQIVLPGGASRALALAISRLPEADPPSVLLIARDMTQERELRVRLMETDRLAAVGELVAGVAHEVNNPLSSISAFSQLLLRESSLTPSQRESVEVIRAETLRASQVVKDLLAFARRSEVQREPLDLNALVARTIRMRHYQFGEASVQVDTQLSDDIPSVLGDGRQLQQVCLNLITNAVQAMSVNGGGNLSLRTGTLDGTVFLEVTDSGPGIQPESRAHIFEPFFTTKPEGEGTGLGLSVSYGIVSAHSGTIEIADTGDHGTTFRVTLPAIAEAPAGSDGGSEPVSFTLRSPLAGIRLLFVDDEPALRSGMEAFGALRGFSVLVAGDGHAALDAARSSGVDAVVCDLRMPGMDGYAFYELLRAERPGLAARTVFITGDVVTSSARGTLSRQPMLTKPFSFDRIEEALIAVMRGTPYTPSDRTTFTAG